MPGALSIIAAHRALEDLTLERDLAHHKPGIEARWADLVYDGQWFSPLRDALDAYIDATQVSVSGEVRLRYEPGSCTVVGRRSEHSLYDLSLATYGAADAFDQSDSRGYVTLYGLPLKVWSATATLEPMTEGSGELWGGRFSGVPAPEAQALGRSLEVDAQLVSEDVQAGIAHVGALRDAGWLTDDDVRRLTEALERVRDAILAGTFAFDPADEDIHSAVERGVTDLLGDLGARLHAGRSRNDLVATDVRLHLLTVQATVSADVRELGRVLVERARAHAADPMPGSTHVRPAQPITLGHHLCAHAWALARDLERFADWRRRASVSPLGAGALATSTLGLDPVATAERLGLDRAFDNSLDAVSDRDVLQECVAVAAICATHLSRLAADLLRWTDPALGWAELDDAYSTGSSMMPQKRNPDTAELARAKAARITGDFVTLGAMLQGLPLGYQRDLQEDKEPAFDAMATLLGVTQALRGAVATLRIDTAAMREACADPGLYATDVAEALVKTGVPFREAHRRTGEFLKRLDADGRILRDATPQEWEAFGVPAGGALLDPDASIAARPGPGGPSPTSVVRQCDALDAILGPQPP